jgi:hypothetical protein
MSFSNVENAVRPGRIGSHDELMAAIYAAPKHELSRYYRGGVVSKTVFEFSSACCSLLKAYGNLATPTTVAGIMPFDF